MVRRGHAVRRFWGAQLTRAVEKLVHAYQIKYFLSYFLPLLPLSLLCVDRHNPLGQQQATKKGKKENPAAACRLSMVARRVDEPPRLLGKANTDPQYPAARRSPAHGAINGRGLRVQPASRVSSCARPKCALGSSQAARRAPHVREEDAARAQLAPVRSFPPNCPTRAPLRSETTTGGGRAAREHQQKSRPRNKKQQKHISHRPTDLELASKPIGARACEQGCPSASPKSENVAGTS